MSFQLLSAAVTASRQLTLTFDTPVANFGAAGIIARDAASYVLSNNATVLTVLAVSGSTVLLYTTELQGLQTYRVTVSGALTNSTAQPLTARTTTFTAPALTTPFVVANLTASSGPRGRRVDLQWENPAGVANTTIIRTLRSWPVDFTETATGAVTVFSDNTAITSFSDVGLSSVAVLTASAAAGVSTISAGPIAFTAGQTVRLVRVTGTYVEETKTVQSAGAGTVTFTTPLSNSFSAGDHVGYVASLNEQTYYYYTVLVSTSASPALLDYDLTDASRAYALSVGVFNSKDTFLWPNTPALYREMDALAVADGGGGGTLDKLYEVMGGWLNVMRGNALAIALRNDPDMAPIDALVAANAAIGFSGEGQSYDYDALRRTFAGLVGVYKKRGTCVGVQEVAQLLVQWATACVEFGQGNCVGLTNMKTWNGQAEVDTGVETALNTITQTVLDSTGRSVLSDPSKGAGSGVVPWTLANRWQGGKVRGTLGEVACVESSGVESGAGKLYLSGASAYVTLTAGVGAGATAITVSDIRGFRPGQRLQLTATTAYTPGAYRAEIVDIAIAGVNVSTSTITLRQPLQYAYSTGARVALQPSILREEFTGQASAITATTLADPTALWVENQWAGYKLLYIDGVVRNIVSNTSSVLTVTGAAMSASGTNGYRIAAGFSSGTFASATAFLGYKVGNSVRAEIFEPTWSVELVAELNDPRNRLWQGPGSPLLGAWGPTDVGIYVTSDITVASGKPTAVLGSTLYLDTIGYRKAGIASLVGYYLNPNQNQTEFFEILIDNGTNIVVAGDISSFVTLGQPYYVLSKRNVSRFQALQKRVFYEFTDTDVRPRLLLV